MTFSRPRLPIYPRTGLEWRHDSAIGKTVVSSGMIDRVAAKLDASWSRCRSGFKWFSSGLIDGSLGVRRRGKRRRTFLRRDGSVWTTDKDGLIMGLLAAEITARTGHDPNLFYASVTQDLGQSFYARIDAPATPEQKARLANLDPAELDAKELAGEPIETKLTKAPGNNEPDRRDQAGRRKRLVCRAAVGNRGCLQDLCGKLPQRRASQADPARCAGHHRPPFQKK